MDETGDYYVKQNKSDSGSEISKTQEDSFMPMWNLNACVHCLWLQWTVWNLSIFQSEVKYFQKLKKKKDVKVEGGLLENGKKTSGRRKGWSVWAAL
jgi:hypothetical protein